MARNRTLTGADLDRLKFEVANEIGFPGSPQGEADFRAQLDRLKYEVASELGIPLRPGYNGDIPAREAGAIGGRLGGPIGGNMVRHMIRIAEEQLAQKQRP